MAGKKSTAEQSKVKRMAFLAEHASRNFLDPAGALLAILPDSPPEQASARASQYLKHPDSVELLKRIQGELFEEIQVDSDRVLKELACIAFLDPADILDDSGSVKPISEIPERARRAIASLDVSIDDLGNSLKKVKFESKKSSLELIGKELGMFVDRKKLEVTGTLGDRLSRARRRTTTTTHKTVNDQGDLVTEETILEDMLE
jgi:phage terminase small subunit